MTQLRIKEAAALLGVSDDTVRRWIDQGRLAARTDSSRRQVVDGADLAALARAEHDAALEALDRGVHVRSARNHFTGLVTRVVSDTVMSQVEMQCGPFRVVSLVSTEAVQDLALEPGAVATAVVKATSVSVEAWR